MSLRPSTRLGRYEVIALVGAGGMGEVYKARDLRLDRTVAVKVLPSDVANDADLCRRFEREGRVISQLNHPHICTLYDVGNHEGTEYLVMEFLEGETLATRLSRGRLPLAQVMAIAREISRALDAAHRQSIVHRDLKPGNVMITRSGSKLLDFGLAKLRDRGAEVTEYLDDRVEYLEAHTSAPSSDSPTSMHPLTGARTVLGTAQYMAPEQIEGREADQRTDIFAFGVLLYEMATGRRAFEASSQGRLIGAILAQDPPPMREIDPSIPRAVETLVNRCIAKDPDDRWQHVRDLMWQVEAVTQRAESEQAAAPRRSWRTHAIWAAAALGMAAGAGYSAYSSRGTVPVSMPTARLHLDLPNDVPLVPDQLSFALSPDGSHFVYRSGKPGATQLFVRTLDNDAVQAIPGTENAHSPFFSPDSKLLGFLSGTAVQYISLAGGGRRELCAVPSLTPGSPGVTWGQNGMVVFAAGLGGLFRVSENGGKCERLTTPDTGRGEELHYGPQFLHGGAELLFMIRLKGGSTRVALLSLKTGKWREVEGITDVVGTVGYVSADNRAYVVYAQPQTGSPISQLRAVELDVARGVVQGGALQLGTVWVQTAGTVSVAHFSVSANGMLAYIADHAPGALVRVSRDNPTAAPTPLTAEPHAYRYPRVSSEGSKVAVVLEDVGSQVAVVEGGLVRQLTNAGTHTHPTWMPGGSRLATASMQEGSDGYDVYAVRDDQNAGAVTDRIIGRPGNQFPSGFSRTGGLLAFYELGDGGRDILLWSPKEEVLKLVATPANERLATFSRDGRFIAYVSNQSNGRDEVWVQKYPQQGGAVQISGDGGTEPVWSPSDDELFFRRRAELVSVRIDANGRRLRPPVTVIDEPYELARPEVGRPNYDVFPGGRSFVMVRTGEAHRQVPLIMNWFSELQRQPAGR